MILERGTLWFGEPTEPIELTPEQVKMGNGFIGEMVDSEIVINKR